MNTESAATPTVPAAPETADSKHPLESEINPFKWLVVLGFPAEIAAAVVHPDTFKR